MIRRLKYLVIPILLVLMLSLPVSADIICPSNGCWINGTIHRWDTNAGISGVVVANSTNASMTYTTGANGNFNISGWDYSNKTATGHVLTITAPAGYVTGFTITRIQIGGNDKVNQISNDTNITNIRPITPVISTILSSGVTKTGATISWTSNNSAVGNRVTYSMDSALGTDVYTTDYSNSTASPSFALSNLQLNKKWYYRAETYNLLNDTYQNVGSILNFTTLTGTYIEDETDGSFVITQTPTSKVVSGGNILISRPQTQSKPINSNNLIVIVLIGLALYLVFSPDKKNKR